ncbi:MAG: DUF3786 domain-containing protein [Desulfobacteraceae bacterium]|nr:DUF3786 domain-containing protein [Desulfobacteraceae bacterium]
MGNSSDTIVDKIHFENLAKRDPVDICRQPLCKYDDVNKRYSISVWGDDYNIYPSEFKIECVQSGNSDPNELFFLFIIYYLLNYKDIQITKEWISEKDIPGGVTFFRGPHEIPTNLISKKYINNIKAFRKKCIELGGIELDMADAAYKFDIVPQIPVAVLYWEGDDDFPAEAKILYDRTIMDHLTSDIVFSLAAEVCARIGEATVF